MAQAKADHESVIRTERGLSIAGTRITLYNVMDYLKADWPPRLVQNWLDITERQMANALHYIEGHRGEVEAEGQLVLEESKKNRQYWEERNRERLVKIESLPPPRGRAKLRAKLDDWKKKLALDGNDPG